MSGASRPLAVLATVAFVSAGCGASEPARTATLSSAVTVSHTHAQGDGNAAGRDNVARVPRWAGPGSPGAPSSARAPRSAGPGSPAPAVSPSPARAPGSVGPASPGTPSQGAGSRQ